MRKALCGLLGLALLNLPLNLSGQVKDKKSYEYNVYLAGKDIGDVKCDKEKFNLNIDWILKKDLVFAKTENNYFEYLKSGNSVEKFYYHRSDSVRLEDYVYYYKDKVNPSLRRESKVKQLKKGYPKNILFGTEVFDFFNQASIPKKIETQVFGEFYSFELDETFGEKVEKDLVRVKYKISVNPKTKTDEFRINEPIQIDLKKDNGKYHIFHIKVIGEIKFIFWIPLNLYILEKPF